MAAHTRLPSSPIDVPDCAPSLSLDLSPVRLFTGPATLAAVVHVGTDTSSIGTTPFSMHFEKAHLGKPVDSFLTLSDAPVAEARESLQVKLTSSQLSIADLPTQCQSPLPGANMAMDFDEHDFEGADLKEPDSRPLSRALHSSSQSLNALASTPVHNGFSLGLSNTVATPDIVADTQAPATELDGSGEHVSPYSGPPSPDRPVILAIRSKISRGDSLLENRQPATSPVSPLSLDTAGRRTSPVKARSEADLTISLLRERTNDAEHLLERMAELYQAGTTTAESSECSSVVSHTPPRKPQLPSICLPINNATTVESSEDSSLASHTPPEKPRLQHIDLAITDTTTAASSACSPVISHTPPRKPHVQSIGLAITTDGNVSQAAQHPPTVAAQPDRLAFPLRSEPAPVIALDHIATSSDDFQPFNEDASSAWLDSSSSIIYEDTAPHNQLSLLSQPSNSSDDGYESSSLFQY